MDQEKNVLKQDFEEIEFLQPDAETMKMTRAIIGQNSKILEMNSKLINHAVLAFSAVVAIKQKAAEETK